VTGKKLWANKEKMATTISNSGKILVTDGAFTGLCLMNDFKQVYAMDECGCVEVIHIVRAGAMICIKGLMKSVDKSIHNARVRNQKQWKWHSWTMQWSNTVGGAPNKGGQEPRSSLMSQ
jgi:vancomycin resistance protein YoaR